MLMDFFLSGIAIVFFWLCGLSLGWIERL